MAIRSAEDAEKQRLTKLLRYIEWTFLGIFLITALVVYFNIQRVVVSGRSMEPTLHNGDALIAWKTVSREKLHEGDVIVFRDANGIELIKRIVFIHHPLSTEKPPEYVTIPGGVRSWQTLFHDYNAAIASRQVARPSPQNTIWVMGDNTDNSEDSRVFGPINPDQIVGQVFVKDIEAP